MDCYIKVLYDLFYEEYEEELAKTLNETQILAFLQINNLTIDDMKHIRTNLTYVYPDRWPLDLETVSTFRFETVKKKARLGSKLDQIIRDGNLIVSKIFGKSFTGKRSFCFLFVFLFLGKI